MPEPTDMIEPTVLPVADPAAELPAFGEAPEQISLGIRPAALVIIVVPLVAVLTAPLLVWGWGIHRADLGLLLVLSILTALGITVGYHRLVVHRSFETNVVVRFVLAMRGRRLVRERDRRRARRGGWIRDRGRRPPNDP